MEYKSLPKYKFASVWWVCRAVKGLNEYLKSDFLSLLCCLRFIAATILNVGRDGLASLAKSLLAQQSKLNECWILIPSPTKREFSPNTNSSVCGVGIPKIGYKVKISPLMFGGCIYTASLCFCDASRREMAPDGNLEAKIICRSGLGWAWIDIHFYYYCTKISKSYLLTLTY